MIKNDEFAVLITENGNFSIEIEKLFWVFYYNIIFYIYLNKYIKYYEKININILLNVLLFHL